MRRQLLFVFVLFMLNMIMTANDGQVNGRFTLEPRHLARSRGSSRTSSSSSRSSSSSSRTSGSSSSSSRTSSSSSRTSRSSANSSRSSASRSSRTSSSRSRNTATKVRVITYYNSYYRRHESCNEVYDERSCGSSGGGSLSTM